MAVPDDDLKRFGHLIAEFIKKAKDFPPEERDEAIKVVLHTYSEDLSNFGMTDDQIITVDNNIAQELLSEVAIKLIHARLKAEPSGEPRE